LATEEVMRWPQGTAEVKKKALPSHRDDFIILYAWCGWMTEQSYLTADPAAILALHSFAGTQPPLVSAASRPLPIQVRVLLGCPDHRC
jgi:hypothetical protein